MFGITIVVTCHTCSPRIRDGRLITSHIVRKTGQTNGRMYTAYDGNWNGFVVDDGTYEFNNEDETVLLVVDATQSGMQHFSVKLLEDATFCKP